MPRTCFVPFCKSGLKTCQEKCAMFAPPKEALLRKKWEKAIRRSDRRMTDKSYICHLHFEEEDVIKGNKMIINNEEVIFPLLRWKLNPGAVPKNFPYGASHRPVKKRKPPMDRSELAVYSRRREISKKDGDNVETMLLEIAPDSINPSILSQSENVETPDHSGLNLQKTKNKGPLHNKYAEKETKKSDDEEDDVVVETLFVHLSSDVHQSVSTEIQKLPGINTRSVALPSPSWNWVSLTDQTTNETRLFCFETVCNSGKLEVRKSVRVIIIDDDSSSASSSHLHSVEYSLYGVQVNKSMLLKSTFSSEGELGDLLRNYHKVAVRSSTNLVPTQD